jgi:hypothetical protein
MVVSYTRKMYYNTSPGANVIKIFNNNLRQYQNLPTFQYCVEDQSLPCYDRTYDCKLQP